jgi:glyoxylase-like metal-dependent hydrolase (beta-lactamase superfamily II)
MRLSERLWRIADSCNVYVIAGSDGALCVDFGTGLALHNSPLADGAPLTDVLMTHHHRDQGQGLPHAIARGAQVWAPHAEQDLFQAVDAHWQVRPVWNNYNMRQDRFSLLHPVPLADTLRDYSSHSFAGQQVEVLPTPGHTTGAISLLTNVDGMQVAFTGDLIAGPGQVWSLAATQWSYNGGEGIAASILSLLDLKERKPDLLLPSHGEPISQVGPAIDLTVERLWELARLRGQNPRLFAFRDQPYIRLSEHLLWNRTSMAYGYVLLSRSGRALFFDYGYDFIPGVAAGSDRASRRPWLATLPALKRQFGVKRIDAMIPTHYHDDHVAGSNLLREVEGAEIWAAANFADILARPARYNLPCLWYDPIPVDRTLPLGTPFTWEEYELTLYPLPGHTRYAVAISLEVDGRRVLLVGDQYHNETLDSPNYVYNNGFDLDDYNASAALYRTLNPELILSGHAAPLEVPRGYFDALASQGETLARLHRELIPPEALSLGTEGYAASIRPYQANVRAGEVLELEITVRNPFQEPARADVDLVAPPGWRVFGAPVSLTIPAAADAVVPVQIMSMPGAVRRARVAADISLNGKPLGQQAEALINVETFA